MSACTSSTRRTEALIRRGALLTASVKLERQLRELETSFNAEVERTPAEFPG
ncbi:MAG TPA: hypothetical protein VK716_01485 [Terracidiphilus sp.]|nr:hypothetical protein [Terracidiphilus sp.]